MQALQYLPASSLNEYFLPWQLGDRLPLRSGTNKIFRDSDQDVDEDELTPNKSCDENAKQDQVIVLNNVNDSIQNPAACQ